MAQQIKKNINKTQNVQTQELSKQEETREVVENTLVENLENSNTNTNETKETPNNYESDIIAELKKENAEKEKQLEEMNKNFQLMQAQLNLLLSQQKVTPSDIRPQETVKVGCRTVYGEVLTTRDGSIVIPFKCDDIKDIDVEDLKTLLKESSSKVNKKLFEQDIFFFVNPSDYERFKISKRIDLSPENITRILLLDTNQMINEVNKLTNNLDMNEHHLIRAFSFGVAKLLIDKSGPLRTWSFQNRETLERYLGAPFNDYLASLSVIEGLNTNLFK